MPSSSDSGQIHDIQGHLRTLLRADTARAVAPDGETEAARRVRESAVFRPRLRARIEQALAAIGAQAPVLSAAEVRKLAATKEGRAAVKEGMVALGRVDDFLQSVTGERNPVLGKRYGVHGDNPESFGGVLQSLSMCVEEDAKIAALPDSDERKDLLFTPVVHDAVTGAHARMTALLGAREARRGELSRGFQVKRSTVDEALAAIAAARQHLYANLPDRKTDKALYDYGFRPIKTRKGSRGKAEEGAEEATAGEAQEAVG